MRVGFVDSCVPATPDGEPSRGSEEDALETPSQMLSQSIDPADEDHGVKRASQEWEKKGYATGENHCGVS